ncbi:MAG: hypothetical protein ACMXYG_05990 [Candidatus Woesearchaeota archaeon]
MFFTKKRDAGNVATRTIKRWYMIYLIRKLKANNEYSFSELREQFKSNLNTQKNNPSFQTAHYYLYHNNNFIFDDREINDILEKTENYFKKHIHLGIKDFFKSQYNPNNKKPKNESKKELWEIVRSGRFKNHLHTLFDNILNKFISDIGYKAPDIHQEQQQVKEEESSSNNRPSNEGNETNKKILEIIRKYLAYQDLGEDESYYRKAVQNTHVKTCAVNLSKLNEKDLEKASEIATVIRDSCINKLNQLGLNINYKTKSISWVMPFLAKDTSKIDDKKTHHDIFSYRIGFETFRQKDSLNEKIEKVQDEYKDKIKSILNSSNNNYDTFKELGILILQGFNNLPSSSSSEKVTHDFDKNENAIVNRLINDWKSKDFDKLSFPDASFKNYDGTSSVVISAPHYSSYLYFDGKKTKERNPDLFTGAFAILLQAYADCPIIYSDLKSRDPESFDCNSVTTNFDDISAFTIEDNINNGMLPYKAKLLEIIEDKKYLINIIGIISSEDKIFLRANNLSKKIQKDIIDIFNYYNIKLEPTNKEISKNPVIDIIYYSNRLKNPDFIPIELQLSNSYRNKSARKKLFNLFKALYDLVIYFNTGKIPLSKITSTKKPSNTTTKNTTTTMASKKITNKLPSDNELKNKLLDYFNSSTKNNNQIEITSKSFKLITGRKSKVILSAPHNVRSIRRTDKKNGEIIEHNSDEMTGAFALLLNELLDCPIIYTSAKSRDANYFNYESSNSSSKDKNILGEVDDSNRQILSYKQSLINYVTMNRSILVIDLHGCNNNHDHDIYIGTAKNDTKDKTLVEDTLIPILSNNGKYSVVLNDRFGANTDETVTKFINKETGVDSMQLEIKKSFRNKDNMDDTIEFFKVLYSLVKNRIENL